MIIRSRMTSPAITVNVKTSIQDCLKLMMEKSLRRFPVVDDQDQIKGLISFVDIDKATRLPGIIPQTPVEWLMVKNPVTIQADQHLEEAVKVMRKYRVTTLPVLDGDQVVGVFSVSDVLDICLDLLSSSK